MYLRIVMIKTPTESVGFPKSIILTEKQESDLIINGYTFSEEKFPRVSRENYAVYLGLTRNELINLKSNIDTNSERQNYEFLIGKYNYYDIAESVDDDIPDIYNNSLDPFYFELFDGKDNILKRIGIYNKMSEDEQDNFEDKYCSLLDEKFNPLAKKIIEEFKQTKEYKFHKRKQNIILKYKKNKSKFTRRFDCKDIDYDICFNVYGRLVNEDYFDKIRKMKTYKEIRIMKNGQKATIINYKGSHNIDVQFEDGTIVTNRRYYCFKNGNIKNPNFTCTDILKKDMKKKRINETRIMNNGMRATIIAYRNSTDIDIQFEDGTIVTHTQYSSFKSGSIQKY